MLTPVSKQVTGEEAKTALLAWAAESLSAQERRFVKLEKAFKEAELDTSGLRKYDLSKRPGTSYQASLEVSLLFFLRGPKSEYDRRNMKRWRDDSINVLVQKGACQRGLRVLPQFSRQRCSTARTLLHAEETRGEREAAAARTGKMNKLRSSLEVRMQAKLRTLPEWSGGDIWAQEHAKEHNKLFKAFVEKTVTAAFPPPNPAAAAGGGAGPEAAAGEEVDIAAVTAAAVETPEFEAAIAQMAKLVKDAKGLSYSVLQATHIQQHGGRYGYGYRGSDSDEDDQRFY